MKRPWAIWVQGARSYALHIWGPSYSTKEAAERGLERFIKKGELVRREDGNVYTTVMGYKVTIDRKFS